MLLTTVSAAEQAPAPPVALHPAPIAAPSSCGGSCGAVSDCGCCSEPCCCLSKREQRKADRQCKKDERKAKKECKKACKKGCCCEAAPCCDSCCGATASCAPCCCEKKSRKKKKKCCDCCCDSCCDSCGGPVVEHGAPIHGATIPGAIAPPTTTIPGKSVEPIKTMPKGDNKGVQVSPTTTLTPTSGKIELESNNPFELAHRYEKRVSRAADYSNLTGQLFFVHTDGGHWVLRYAPLSDEDAHGGSVVLTRDRMMNSYREGDLVTVAGQVISEKSSAHLGGALFQVHTISLVDRPAK
jgi:hypothetical protein